MAEVNEGKRLLTDAQILKYAIPLVQEENFSNQYLQENENSYEFIARISEELKSNEKVFEYYTHLKRVGFKSDKIETKMEMKLLLPE